MKLSRQLIGLFYEFSLHELRLINENTQYPSLSYHNLLYLDLISITKECTGSKIAALLHISRPAVTARVNELIRLGLVVKTVNETDRRVYFLTLSDELQEEYQQYNGRLCQSASYLEERYTPQELALLSRMLEDFRKGYLTENDERTL